MTKIYTRRDNGEIREFSTFKEALKDSEDMEVWKITLELVNGETVRLVKQENGFVLAPLPPPIPR